MPSTTNHCDSGKAQSRTIALNVVPATGASKIRPSRMSRWRAGVLIGINVLMIAHVIQWYFGGRTLTPIEPSETMYTLEGGQLNMGFIFFSLALLATLIFGRFVCGWGCHIVALQDLCAWILKKIGIRPKPFRSRVLAFVPLLAALYMFVWPSAYRLFLKPPHNRFPPLQAHLTTNDFWATFAPWQVAIPFLFICGFAVVYFLGAKGFCTYGCPYGGFFGLLDQVSPGRIRVTEDCEQCGHCTAVCTSNVKVHEEVRLHGMVVDPGCMKCMDCVSVCPNDALYFGFGLPRKVAAPRRTYSITLIEELLAVGAFAAAFFCVRDVYDSVPFLMALGSAGIFAFCTVKVLHLVRRRDVTIQTWVLKIGNQLRRSAFVFGGLFLLETAFVVHCGLVQYHEHAGYKIAMAMPAQELVLGGDDIQKIMKPEQAAQVSEGERHYGWIDRYGLIAMADTKRRLAWFRLVRGDRNAALVLLDEALTLDHPRTQARTRMYRGQVHALLGQMPQAQEDFRAAMRQNGEIGEELTPIAREMAANGHMAEALLALDEIVAMSPRLAAAQHVLALIRFTQGRPDEAIKHFEAALAESANSAELHFQYAAALSQVGRDREASEHLNRAIELDPRYRQAVPGGSP